MTQKRRSGNYEPGGKRYGSKLTDAQAFEIKRRRASYKNQWLENDHPDSLMSMAAEFGVSRSRISLVAHGKVWKHIEI